MNIDFPFFFNFFNSILVFILIYVIIDRTTQNRTHFYDLLTERNREVSDLNATLEEKVMERTSELEAQSKMLERSNEEIKRFSHITSHDLREPLRNVMSFTQLIERDIELKKYDNLEEYMTYVKFGVTRLDTLTKDISLYTEIEERLSETTTFDSLDLLQEVLQDLPILEQHPLTKISYQPLPSITANREIIYYVFYHIISNAIEYCDKDFPVIEVKTESFDKYHLFGIKDNGRGIPSKFYAEIFMMFRRLHNQVDKMGSGIGLAICKKIVEGYQGRIWVESVEGEGLTFFFTLPK